MSNEYLYKKQFPNGNAFPYVGKEYAKRLAKERGIGRANRILGLIASYPLLRDSEIMEKYNQHDYKYFGEVCDFFYHPDFANYYWTMYHKFKKSKIIKDRIEKRIPECTGSKISCEKLLEWCRKDNFEIDDIEYLKKYYALPFETNSCSEEGKKYLAEGYALYKNITSTAMLVAFKKEENPVLYQGVEDNSVCLISKKLEQM